MNYDPKKPIAERLADLRALVDAGRKAAASTLVLIAFALTGCNSQSEHVAPLQADIAPSRFKVESHGAFRCNQPDRESKRAIYIITDTDVRYLAVQGCGTSQLVTEKSGKTDVTVER